jgi:hypothetical protein
VRPARWIDLGVVDPIAFHAAYAGLAEAQGPDADPLVVWGRARAHLCLGQSQGRCELDEAIEVPVVRRPLGGGAVWVDEDQLSYAIVAPLGLAPLRHADWYGWALAPAIATFRAFRLEVDRCAEDLWLARRKIAGSGAATIGRCAVVARASCCGSRGAVRGERRDAGSAFAPRCGALGTAMTDWSSHAVPPDEDSLGAAFRARCAIRSAGTRLPRRPRRRVRGDRDWREELAAPIEAGARASPAGSSSMPH